MRICCNCGSDKTRIRKRDNRPSPIQEWYKYKDGYICNKCYCKLIDNPKWNYINNPKQLRYKGRGIQLKENPRTGYCSLCTNNIYDGSCKRTHMHHFAEYHDDDPLRDTIELCVSCHRREHGKYIYIRVPTDTCLLKF
jgi:hypothetical protein